MDEAREIELQLEDGTVFKGRAFGDAGPASGEVVFNTGMVGYPESLTDPSYKGLILTFTYPLVGNYGVPDYSVDDGILRHFESDKIHVKGVVVSEHASHPSHWSSAKSLDAWLKENRIPGIIRSLFRNTANR